MPAAAASVKGLYHESTCPHDAQLPRRPGMKRSKEYEPRQWVQMTGPMAARPAGILSASAWMTAPAKEPASAPRTMIAVVSNTSTAITYAECVLACLTR